MKDYMKKYRILQFKKKVLWALKQGMITPEQLAEALRCHTDSQFQKLMDTVNTMYTQDELVPVMMDGQKKLLLTKN